MVGSFGPVEAGPRQSAPRRLEGGHIEADAGEPRDTGRRDVKPLFRRHREESALYQTLCYGDPKSSCEVIVANTGVSQLLRFCASAPPRSEPFF